MIENFSILSERCTGSHFVQYALTENFHINYLNKYHPIKHFFGHENNSYSSEEINNTLFICVIRDPVEWIDSYFKRLHFVPQEKKGNIHLFLNSEWYSIYEEGENFKKEVMEDRNMYTKERYKNIFDLRKTKNNYFLETMPLKCKHVLILKYEDLRDNYKQTLDAIKNKYELKQKLNEYKEIIKYKGSYHALYNKKPILLSSEIQEYIRMNVDLDQEQKMGYLLNRKKIFCEVPIKYV